MAETAHHYQMLATAETAIALSVLDNARGQARPNTRQSLEFIVRRVVDINKWKHVSRGERRFREVRHLDDPFLLDARVKREHETTQAQEAKKTVVRCSCEGEFH